VQNNEMAETELAQKMCFLSFNNEIYQHIRSKVQRAEKKMRLNHVHITLV
jgi:hypothetical protein